jgi:hypothetical protein
MPSTASRKTLLLIVVMGVLTAGAWKFFQPENPAAYPPPATPQDAIPASIIVTESSPTIPPPPVDELAPGDGQLSGYGNPATPPKNDLLLLAKTLSNFLLLAKQAPDHPLSANEEWSAALRGKRLGNPAWLSEKSPVLDAQHRLIDRWHTPLFFHALGAKQWEIRSAGPDLRLWTEDDLMQKTVTRSLPDSDLQPTK